MKNAPPAETPGYGGNFVRRAEWVARRLPRREAEVKPAPAGVAGTAERHFKKTVTKSTKSEKKE
jgi:hypothetical protein